MSLVNLAKHAQNCPQAWSSSVISKIGNANFKVLKMDEMAYPAEEHPFTEILLVIDGQLNLMVHDNTIIVHAGEMYIVPPDTPHSVTQGSHGTLVILDT